ncbi:MAG TPA: sigma-54 dependent transcriptional regulator [Phycisphaerae bacterium]|nr:sigma-54 dependent transcriptional regulator [Phycisphaerae bacterium]HRY70394.1 sigma-54 dependent transcriptional regulator [Phycisphaerae bacterium]HSA28111.1 sigma-54 dependent transcriptional regulator [Phycisphaerae bacterium]
MGETAFILIVEDDGGHAEALANGLREQGHACRVVQSAAEALESLHSRQPDVILAEKQLLQAEGNGSVLRESERLAPDAEIILMAPEEEAHVPGGEIHEGQNRVFQVVAKPVSFEDIQGVIHRAAELAKRHRADRALKEQAERRFEFEGIVTGNGHMMRIIRMIQRVANSKLTVLILGESGTGKELVAQAIHRHSPRTRKPYRAINCAGLNENLLESQLFGHVKGAFTGAVSDHKGLFEVVDGGTLFLDEVGDMPIPMQAKLLRTLENGEILPVGGNEIRRVDVRVVAATRRDIREMVEKHTFRDDLFYRLNQAMIRIPPLRERRDDIPLLIEHFLNDAAKVHDKPATSISPEVVRKLTGSQWPGNIRELRSVIDQMVVLAEGPEITVDDLPEHIRGSTDIVLAALPGTTGLTMEQMEKLHIASTLKLTGGNREKTAKILGIGARTLYRKLREYGL